VICSSCDRGQTYCSEACRSTARRRLVREAGERYQRTDGGRENHTRRQKLYRFRKAGVLERGVTHQSSPQGNSSGNVAACTSSTPSAMCHSTSTPNGVNRRRRFTPFGVEVERPGPCTSPSAIEPANWWWWTFRTLTTRTSRPSPRGRPQSAVGSSCGDSVRTWTETRPVQPTARVGASRAPAHRLGYA